MPPSVLPRVPPAVLLTRPSADSSDLADRLRGLGAKVVISPLLQIRFAEALPTLADALILTSPNGVAAYRALGGAPGLPVWCVGPRTADIAREAGLEVQGVAPDAAALLALIPQGAPALCHLRGAVQRGDLAADLRARGLRASDAVIYHQDAAHLTQAAQQMLLAGPTVVPLYSPRTARLFAEQCPEDAWPDVCAVALSAAVAEMLPIRAKIALSPEGNAMWTAIMEQLGGSAVEGRAGSH